MGCKLQDQRRRSLTSDNSAALVAELANVLSELKGVKDVFEAYKASNSNDIKNRETPERVVNGNNKVCENCEEKSKVIDSMKDEIGFYKKKNKELTNQVLQTEDRWSREIEKQTHGYRSQVASPTSISTNKRRFRFTRSIQIWTRFRKSWMNKFISRNPSTLSSPRRSAP